MLDPNRAQVGSLVRLYHDCGTEETLGAADPRYKPGVVVEVTGHAITIIWSGVRDPECWASKVIEVLA